MSVSQRPDWHGEPKELGESFLLGTGNTHRPRYAMFSRHFGFELRLLLGSKWELLRSQVWRSDDEVLTTAGQWTAELREHGWA